MPALCGRTANRDVAALLELHLGLKPELDRCRSGERIRNLRLAERIDSGGMGAVYRATQAFSDGIEREVAVKLIHPALLLQEPREAQRRFEAEIGTLAALEHKGIARIYDGGVDRCAERGDETLYIAMELVRGAALTDHVAAHRAELGIAGILRLFLRVCDAVAYAHRRGVVHRDLKPANILVDQHGEPRVLDFGLAAGWSRAAASAEPAELIGGTPLYMSPEQLAGAPAMPAMDVYALGAILHELLAGRRAHGRRPLSTSARQPPDAAARLRALCGAELARIVSSALAPQAADRPPSVAEFAQTLSCCLDAIDTRWHKLQLARRCLIGNLRTRGLLDPGLGLVAARAQGASRRTSRQLFKYRAGTGARRPRCSACRCR